MKNIMRLKKAIKRFTKAIKNDPELKETYKANIAMAFKDEYQRYKKEKRYLNNNDIHEMANQAADNFLTLLCLEK